MREKESVLSQHFAGSYQCTAINSALLTRCYCQLLQLLSAFFISLLPSSSPPASALTRLLCKSTRTFNIYIYIARLDLKRVRVASGEQTGKRFCPARGKLK